MGRFTCGRRWWSAMSRGTSWRSPEVMVVKNSRHATRRFGAAEDGAVAIEFAFVISILIVILLGAYECTRYILLNLKADRTSSTVADLVAQSDGMTIGILNDIYSAAIGQM